MKRVIIVSLVSLSITSSFGQQWTGSTDVNNAIFRNGNIGFSNLIFGKLGYSLGSSDPYNIYSQAGGNQDMILFGNSENTLNLRLLDGALKFGYNELPVAQILNDGSGYFSKLGIGTASPQGYLHVNPTRPVIIKNNGGNGIYGSEIGFNAVLNTDVLPNQFKKLGGTGQHGAASMIVDYEGNMLFQMFNGSTENEVIVPYNPQIIFSNTGCVGIGTTDPKGYKLAVAGKIISEEVVVKLIGNWPDYVFEKDYKLPSLEELQLFITEHKHLPGVPSANEVEENGLAVGEVNAILLKKIEELTLYVIELKNENEQQNEIIKSLLKK